MKKILNFWRYAFPVIIVLLVLYAALLSANLSLRQEMDARCENSLEFIIKSLDEQLFSTENAARTILDSRTAVVLGTRPDLFSGSGRLPYQLVTDIRNFCKSNTLISDLLCYYPQAGFIVGKNGLFTDYQYYKTLYPSTERADDAYRHWSSAVIDQSGIQLVSYQPDGSESFDLYYISAYPMNVPAGECTRILILLFDKQAVSDYVASFSNLLSIQSLTMTGTNGLVYCNWTSAESDGSDAGHLFVQMDSDVWQMEISLEHSTGSAYTTLYALQKNFLFLFLLCCVLGLSLSSIAFFQSRKRLNALNTKFARKDPAPGSDADAFGLLSAQIDQLLRENDENLKELEAQNEMIGFAFLKELLYSPYTDEADIDRLCSAMDVYFENAAFVLFVISGLGQDYTSVRERAHRIISDFSSDTSLILWTRVNEQNVFLCNCDSLQCPPQAMEETLAQLFPQCRIFRSGIFSKSAHICREFSTLYYCATHTSFLHSTRQNEKKTGDVSTQFIDSVQMGNLKKARKLLPKLQQWVLDTANSKQQTCARYTFLSELYELSFFQNKTRSLESLFLDYSGKNWSEILYECLTQGGTAPSNIRQSIAEQAMCLIQEHYADTQIGLAWIAETLDISQSYLSRSFKQAYGVGITTMLNQIRIDQAKALMRQDGLTIRQIAIRVGFSSDMNFIRVFKRFEHQPPHTYRKELQPESADSD